MNPMAKLLEAVAWEKTCEPEDVAMADDEVPFVTHSGMLKIGGIELRCYQLNTGQRVFDEDDIARLFGGDFLDGKP